MKYPSKTAAIREARRYVSIQGGGTSWEIISPFDELDGPSTSATAVSYFDALARARAIKARIALNLMGKFDENADYAIYNDGQYATTLEELVDVGLKASGV